MTRRLAISDSRVAAGLAIDNLKSIYAQGLRIVKGDFISGRPFHSAEFCSLHFCLDFPVIHVVIIIIVNPLILRSWPAC